MRPSHQVYEQYPSLPLAGEKSDTFTDSAGPYSMEGHLKGCGMEIVDYSPYLSVHKDGSIWWRREDAIKLGAGYLPICDDRHNLNPVLRARNGVVQANERALIGALSPAKASSAKMRVLKHDNDQLVEAHDFLVWLFQHLFVFAELSFPDGIACAVAEAVGASAVPSSPKRFESLVAALKGRFDQSITDMPKKLRVRLVEHSVVSFWDTQSVDWRRTVALNLDYLHDPATAQLTCRAIPFYFGKTETPQHLLGLGFGLWVVQHIELRLRLL